MNNTTTNIEPNTLFLTRKQNWCQSCNRLTLARMMFLRSLPPKRSRRRPTRQPWLVLHSAEVQKVEPNMEPQRLHLFNPFFPDTGRKILKSDFWTLNCSCSKSFCKNVDFLTFLAQTDRGTFFREWITYDHINFYLWFSNPLGPPVL